MSFGGFGGGFGQAAQQNRGAFGGFGAAANTTPAATGFGATNTGFGSPANNTAGGGLFGAGAAAPSAFGGGGFGANNNTNSFGAKPAFGSPATTSAGNMFGGGGTTTAGGFGGFGAAATPAFGAANNTNSLFGSPKPATGFGASPAATTNPFGGTASPFGGGATSGFSGASTTENNGTQSVPFVATMEKEGTSNMQNAFQSVCMQPAYAKFSPEELRLVDYSKGLRYPQNQGTSFGTGTNFGGGFGSNQAATTGFGSTPQAQSGGLFGQPATSSPFGSTQPAAGGFGSPATGGLFGAPKPAAPTSLFGNPQPQPATGGLFGQPAATGFGASAAGGFGTTPAASSSNLFGNNNAAPKPGGFSFGATPAASTGGFGSTPAASTGFGGGAFGTPNNTQQTTASAFGSTPASTFGAFGAPQSQQSAGGLFGKPAATGGLFGQPAATSAPNLFGSPAPASTNPFGGTTNGGLFGAPKPAGNSLFGTPPATQPNSGGGLFSGLGQSQNQSAPAQGTLFGYTPGPAKPSLFGSQPTGASNLFGNSGSQQQPGGLFGAPQTNNQAQQQTQQNGFGASFGGNQSQNHQNLTTSISEQNAYGTPTLFNATDSNALQQSRGPIATPLSSSVRQRKVAALPLYKLNSSSSSRLNTPTKRGYSLTYTPNSASVSANSTPGIFGNSLLSGNRSLSRSMSTNNLRRSIAPAEDSILSPGAFSNSLARQGTTGSMKKLVINRSLRGDLFSSPQSSPPQAQTTPQKTILKKQVSFEPVVTDNGNVTSPLKEVHNNAGPASSAGDVNSTPEMQQVQKNNELAIVPEHGASQEVVAVNRDDLAEGDYWSTPTLDELRAMNQIQKQKISGLKIGRENVGYIQFDNPVDLSNINLDRLFGEIVILHVRSAEVYPDNCIVSKPPMGKGLNVPSTISLMNSWPRSKDKRLSGSATTKHINKLKKIPGTEFISYDANTGTWVFTVEHYTKYAMDYEDEESDGEATNDFGNSTLSAAPDTPTPRRVTPRAPLVDVSFVSEDSLMTQTESDPEDTFDFKKRKILPGAFDREEVFIEDDSMGEESEDQDAESFLDERSVGSDSESAVEEPFDEDDSFQEDGSVSIVDQEMAGSYPEAGNTAEQEDDSQDGDEQMGVDTFTPGGIMRAQMRAKRIADTPTNVRFASGNDWAATLRTTVSPQKQDRALLKSLIDVHGNGKPRDVVRFEPTLARSVSGGHGFATSIDLMNSLFDDAKSPAKTSKVTATKGFPQWPYDKNSKLPHDSVMTEDDEQFHDSMKPSWGYDGTLVYAGVPHAKAFSKSSRRREKEGILDIQKSAIVSEKRDVRFARFSNESSASALRKQQSITKIALSSGVPFAQLPEDLELSYFIEANEAQDPSSTHEKLVWELASILFDAVAVPGELADLPDVQSRLRKDQLSAFWQKLVDHASTQHVALARSHEEKAIASLSGHKITDACAHLINGRDFHLATMVSLIGSKESLRKDVREQLNEWKKSRVLAEFSQPVRTVYELLAGNACFCAGSKGAAEDQMKAFDISTRFGLDWRQAFGLRLWYATLPTEEIGAAVEQYDEDLENEKEKSKPVAWYVEQKIPTLWDDGELAQRQDLLWGLLKLATFEDADLEAVLRPENSQLSPVDARLSWQLSRALTTARLGPRYWEESDEKKDKSSLAFASQLTNEGSWVEAVFVLLHLTSADARAQSIREHLARHAGRIGSEDSPSFLKLQEFRIPSSWVWEAKALYSRSVEHDCLGEVACLVKAGLSEEAHRTFCKEVGPRTIIEQDYDTLRSLLAGFEGKEHAIADWYLGGEIYLDFLAVMASHKKAPELDMAVVRRLMAALPAAVEESRHPSFMETVAIETISGVFAKVVVEMGKRGEPLELAKMLRLPLTEDAYLKHTVDLSLGYYKSVMAVNR